MLSRMLMLGLDCVILAGKVSTTIAKHLGHYDHRPRHGAR